MTNLAITPDSAGAETGEARNAPPTSWLARAMLDTLGKTSARMGVAWISIVAFCAVFAPLLANSYPLLVKMKGRWSSPAAQHFTPADVTLLVLTFVAIVLFGLLRRLPLRARMLTFVGVTVLTILL